MKFQFYKLRRSKERRREERKNEQKEFLMYCNGIDCSYAFVKLKVDIA